jgi:hypothetical protein
MQFSALGTDVGSGVSVLSGEPVDGSTWGLEVLGNGGWQLNSSRWGRRAPRFHSYEDAVNACVAEWKKSDRPVRPLRLDTDAS